MGYSPVVQELVAIGEKLGVSIRTETEAEVVYQKPFVSLEDAKMRLQLFLIAESRLKQLKDHRQTSSVPVLLFCIEECACLCGGEVTLPDAFVGGHTQLTICGLPFLEKCTALYKSVWTVQKNVSSLMHSTTNSPPLWTSCVDSPSCKSFKLSLRKPHSFGSKVCMNVCVCVCAFLCGGSVACPPLFSSFALGIFFLAILALVCIVVVGVARDVPLAAF